MTDTTALKPCPTCGETNAAFLCSDGYHYGWYASWNTRADTCPADSGLADEQRVQLQSALWDVLDRYDLHLHSDVVRALRECVENFILSALTPATTFGAKIMGDTTTLKPFEREWRYIVVKRKHLTAEQETALLEHIARLELPPFKCAVVESDWPEYEPVWKMIEARVTGNTRPADSGLAGELTEEQMERLLDDVGLEQSEDNRCLVNDIRSYLSAITPATTDYDALLGELQVWATVMREADRPGMEGAARAFDEAAAAIRHLSARDARLREALEGSISRLGIIRITAELEDELDDRISLVQRSMLKALQENDRG